MLDAGINGNDAETARNGGLSALSVPGHTEPCPDVENGLQPRQTQDGGASRVKPRRTFSDVDDDGAILDGRNRFLACEEAGVTKRFRKFGDLKLKMSADQYAFEKNMERRHLT